MIDLKLNYVTICLSDNLMDQKGQFHQSLNQRSQKCSYCHFPDIDQVPEPYLIGRGITRPGELDLAEVGNFFVRERARAILDVVCPGQCVCHPTFDVKTRALTDWSLAVPTRTVVTGTVKMEIPRCPECGEPKVAHWGSQYDWTETTRDSFSKTIGADIAKSSNWFSAEVIGEESRWYWMNILKLKQPPKVPSHQWTRLGVNRWLYLSIRLERLFQSLKLKGMVRLISDEAKPSRVDLEWVDEQIRNLKALGLSTPSPRVANSMKGGPWFREYLTKHAREPAPSFDFSEVEDRIGKPLPPSYKAFLSKVGPTTFHDLDAMEGFDAKILGPDSLDQSAYRRGMIEVEEEENALIDGLLFATTGHGDAFCFDLAGEGPEYPVYLFEHDSNSFQAYAPDFEACLKRFAGEESASSKEGKN